MPWLPPQIKKGKDQYADKKRDKRQVLKGKFAIYNIGVKMKKLADHPVGIGSDPNNHRQVMAKFAHVMPGTDGNNNGNRQGWKDHGNTQRPPNHAPTDVFK